MAEGSQGSLFTALVSLPRRVIGIRLSDQEGSMKGFAIMNQAEAEQRFASIA